ncbi:MAG: hypothetical protein ACI9IV_002191 [Paracoccaceae bacterium]|jgi:hypothetical protein
MRGSFCLTLTLLKGRRFSRVQRVLYRHKTLWPTLADVRKGRTDRTGFFRAVRIDLHGNTGRICKPVGGLRAGGCGRAPEKGGPRKDGGTKR